LAAHPFRRRGNGTVRPVLGGGNHNFDAVQKPGAARFDAFGKDFLKALSGRKS
jgi:hypothetical protein